MQSFSEQIVYEIGRKIAGGDIQPGETLPKVEDISEQYGVSRTVVREALKGLAARKMIRSNQRSGTVVLQKSNWQLWDLDVITWLSEVEVKDGEFLIQLTEIRLALEPLAASLATQRATEQDISNIKETFLTLEKTVGNEKEWAKADFYFHQSIYDASHNDLLISMLKLLRKGLIISREKTMSALSLFPEPQFEEPNLEVLQRHKALHDALVARDTDEAQVRAIEIMVRAKQLLEKMVEYQK
ncbi:GntR family transcriptional regulator [Psychrobacillus insolitus]|uniref:GntR family transcriptional regulator n=1 Tax=Psychrobacillus insolitus TaxID=1461 RepID=A0A2W7MEU6_9BACI|nr:FadR/GntR family transcriptional regulator [Psychrobacillus insolitus]PZX03662.1 GntR family transcriptional regulator [Psychrobacillus insolitus]